MTVELTPIEIQGYGQIDIQKQHYNSAMGKLNSMNNRVQKILDATEIEAFNLEEIKRKIKEEAEALVKNSLDVERLAIPTFTQNLFNLPFSPVQLFYDYGIFVYLQNTYFAPNSIFNQSIYARKFLEAFIIVNLAWLFSERQLAGKKTIRISNYVVQLLSATHTMQSNYKRVDEEVKILCYRIWRMAKEIYQERIINLKSQIRDMYIVDNLEDFSEQVVPILNSEVGHRQDVIKLTAYKEEKNHLVGTRCILPDSNNLLFLGKWAVNAKRLFENNVILTIE